MSEESEQETALFVSDGQGGYYAIPRVDLERYRMSAQDAAEVARKAAREDTAGYLLRSRWENSPVSPEKPGGEADPALAAFGSQAPGFAVSLPMVAFLRR
jgi:hypothetical protein